MRIPTGMTAMHWAAEGGHPKVLQYLLGAGGDVGAGSDEGLTPMHHAARRGHLEAAIVLANAGVWKLKIQIEVPTGFTEWFPLCRE